MPGTTSPLVASLHVAPVQATPDVEIQLRFVELANGEIIPWRAIQPSDAIALQEFHETLSDATIHHRFFHYMPHLSDRMAHRFTNVDGRNRQALVALDPANTNRIIAVTRIDRNPGTTEAEYAAVVTDAWQGRGLGKQLSRELIDRAMASGIETLTAEVLPENRHMLHLFRDLGFPVSITFEDGVAHVRIDLTAIPASI